MRSREAQPAHAHADRGGRFAARALSLSLAVALAALATALQPATALGAPPLPMQTSAERDLVERQLNQLETRFDVATLERLIARWRRTGALSSAASLASARGRAAFVTDPASSPTAPPEANAALRAGIAGRLAEATGDRAAALDWYRAGTRDGVVAPALIARYVELLIDSGQADAARPVARRVDRTSLTPETRAKWTFFLDDDPEVIRSATDIDRELRSVWAATAGRPDLAAELAEKAGAAAEAARYWMQAGRYDRAVAAVTRYLDATERSTLSDRLVSALTRWTGDRALLDRHLGDRDDPAAEELRAAWARAIGGANDDGTANPTAAPSDPTSPDDAATSDEPPPRDTTPNPTGQPEVAPWEGRVREWLASQPDAADLVQRAEWAERVRKTLESRPPGAPPSAAVAVAWAEVEGIHHELTGAGNFERTQHELLRLRLAGVTPSPEWSSRLDRRYAPWRTAELTPEAVIETAVRGGSPPHASAALRLERDAQRVWAEVEPGSRIEAMLWGQLARYATDPDVRRSRFQRATRIDPDAPIEWVLPLDALPPEWRVGIVSGDRDRPTITVAVGVLAAAADAEAEAAPPARLARPGDPLAPIGTTLRTALYWPRDPNGQTSHGSSDGDAGNGDAPHVGEGSDGRRRHRLIEWRPISPTFERMVLTEPGARWRQGDTVQTWRGTMIAPLSAALALEDGWCVVGRGFARLDANGQERWRIAADQPLDFATLAHLLTELDLDVLGKELTADLEAWTRLRTSPLPPFAERFRDRVARYRRLDDVAVLSVRTDPSDGSTWVITSAGIAGRFGPSEFSPPPSFVRFAAPQIDRPAGNAASTPEAWTLDRSVPARPRASRAWPEAAALSFDPGTTEEQRTQHGPVVARGGAVQRVVQIHGDGTVFGYVEGQADPLWRAYLPPLLPGPRGFSTVGVRPRAATEERGPHVSGIVADAVRPRVFVEGDDALVIAGTILLVRDAFGSDPEPLDAGAIETAVRDATRTPSGEWWVLDETHTLRSLRTGTTHALPTGAFDVEAVGERLAVLGFDPVRQRFWCIRDVVTAPEPEWDLPELPFDNDRAGRRLVALGEWNETLLIVEASIWAESPAGWTRWIPAERTPPGQVLYYQQLPPVAWGDELWIARPWGAVEVWVGSKR